MRISNINKQNTAAMRKHWCPPYPKKPFCIITEPIFRKM